VEGARRKGEGRGCARWRGGFEQLRLLKIYSLLCECLVDICLILVFRSTPH